MQPVTGGAVALTGALAAGLALGVSGAAAQAPEEAVTPDVEDARTFYQKARAVEATDDRSQQLTAAWLYRQAARLWPEGHEKRHRSLWRAAHLYLHHGHGGTATALFGEAARAAQTDGRPARAAHCHLRLARIAAEQGRREGAREALARARPLIAEGDYGTAERQKLRTMRSNVLLVLTELAVSSS